MFSSFFFIFFFKNLFYYYNEFPIRRRGEEKKINKTGEGAKGTMNLDKRERGRESLKRYMHHSDFHFTSIFFPLLCNFLKVSIT